MTNGAERLAPRSPIWGLGMTLDQPCGERDALRADPFRRVRGLARGPSRVWLLTLVWPSPGRSHRFSSKRSHPWDHSPRSRGGRPLLVSPPPRCWSSTFNMVSVSSGAHRRGHIDLSDLNWDRRRYQRWAAYSQSKLANLLFILELQRRLTAAGSPVRALAAHPGYAATNLQSHSGNVFMDRMMRLTNRIIAQSQDMGALPTVYAASQDLPGGSYVGPSGRSELRGNPTLVGRSAEASDAELAAALWTASEELTGVASPLSRLRRLTRRRSP